MLQQTSPRLPTIFLCSLLVALLLPSASANEVVRPFVPGTMAKILAERQGRPFILSLWSVSCTHCPEELKVLGRLKQAHPGLDIVLVSTDSPEEGARVQELASRHGLGRVPQWVFSEAMPERLRFEIDRRWHGELPRTLFYDRQHAVEGVSGLVPQEKLARWIKENLR